MSGAGSRLAENRQLTGLRGIAAVNVMIAHLSGGETGFWRLIDDANLAVDLFFCLSAFTLCMVYRAGSGARLDWRGFALARVARIYPIYLVGLAFGAYTTWHFTGWFTAYHGAIRPDLLRQLFMVNAWPVLGNGISWDGPSWSVSVEVLCYLACFPAMFLATRAVGRLSANTRTALMLLAGGISFACFIRMFDARITYGWNGAPVPMPHASLWVLSIRGVVMFGAGWLAWASFIAGDALAEAANRLMDALALLFLLIIAGHGFGVIDRHVGVVLCPFIVLGLARGGSVTARLLASRPVHYLGTISFSIYLLHMPVMYAVMFRLPFLSETHGEAGWLPWMRVLLDGGITLVLASLSYRVIEAPGRRLLRRAFGMRASAHGQPGIA